MIKHYLKIAVRNLLKYKSQSAISILGLAVGFTCFALSAMWIRYELTYDDFHEGADRMYYVRVASTMDNSGISSITPYPLAGYLKETFPEVEDACNTQAWNTKYKYKQTEKESYQITADSAMMNMFRLEIVSGSRNFMNQGSNEIAISDRLAGELFGTESPLGKELEIYGQKQTVCAIVKGWSTHSNMPFEIVESNRVSPEWYMSSWQTFLKLRKGTDIKAFEKKLSEHTIKAKEDIKVGKIELTPLTAMRYDRPSREETVKFDHILLFAAAGGLVILCSLFNFLTLFVTRMRMRGKEIALRRVCGSSNRSLLALFSAEYLLTLLLALFTGMILLELMLPAFKELSDIKTSNSGVYLETVGYSGIVACLSFFFSLAPIYYFRRQSLQSAIKGSADGRNRNIFQRVSMVLQLVISIGFIFCSSIMMKQIHHLNHVDVGMERKNRASFSSYPDIDGFRHELSQIPHVTEIFADSLDALFPRFSRSFQNVDEWDDKPASASPVSLEMMNSSQAYMDFYKLRLIEGNMPDPGSTNQMLVNEAAVKALGINHPIGKTIRKGSFTITGVVSDFYIAPPTIPVKPMALKPKDGNYRSNIILFKFREGTWDACKQQIEKAARKLNPNLISVDLFNMDEEYQKYLKSENALLKMLDFVTLVCIIISLFGIFSLVTLDCEQQRKSIAVRKVSGATTAIIIRIFFRKYILLLGIAAALAFPLGYLIMQSWIEGYVLQTTIGYWIYPAILAIIACIITLCTGWRVWRAANQNPAEVIRSE